MKNKYIILGAAFGLLSLLTFTAFWSTAVNTKSVLPGPNDIMVAVFQDFNGDGVRQPSTEPLLPGLTLTAYNGLNAQAAQDNVGTSGNYLLNVGAGTGDYRVEVTNLPAGLQPGAVGTSTVFFAAAGETISVALENPDQYSQDDPALVTTCFIEGPQPGGTGETFIRFDYDSGCFDAGINATCDDGGTFGGPKAALATSNDIGSTYGVAYQRATRSAFAAAFMKRHTGFKSNGKTGVIYRIQNPGSNSPTTSEYIDFDALGIPTRPLTGDPHPADNADQATWERDSDSWDWVGKMSFGDIDISEDGETLYVVNLFDRRLYSFPAKSTPYTAADAGLVQSVAISSPCGAGVDFRPFGLGIHDGKVYIGTICSGESTIGAWAGGKIPANSACTVNTAPAGSRASLSANIYEYNPATGVLNTTPVLTFPLNYGRGRAINSGNGTTSATWNPWVTEWTVFNRPANGSSFFQDRSYPQPMFTDIEFDGGNMVLGFRDRFGDQTGHLQRPPTGFSINVGSAFDGLYDGVAEGDILRACGDATTGWTLESGGQCGGVSGPAAPNSNSNGPGGGEYYSQDDYDNFHNEVTQGGMVIVPGHEEVATIMTDPINSSAEFYDAGVVWYRNSDGERVQNFLVFSTAVGVGDDDGPTFAKANGLGDMIALSDPTPIQVGNRVWFDTNDDGVQSPNEPGINGVTVELFKDIGGTLTKVAETTTAANAVQGDGAFKFTNSTEQTWSNGQTEMLPNMDYEIRISLANVTAQMANVNAFATQNVSSNATNNNKTDLSDSDANSSGVIAFTTGDAGENNHTLDIGVTAAVACLITVNSATASACDPATNTYSLTVNVTYADAPAGEMISVTTNNGGSMSFTPAGTAGTEDLVITGLTSDGVADIDVTANYVTTTGCTNTNTDAYTAPASCTPVCSITVNSATASACDPATNTYSLTVNVTYADAPAGEMISVTTSNGGSMSFTPAGTAGTEDFVITGLTSDGVADIDVTANYVTTTGCTNTNTDAYTAPASCTPVCSITVNSATASACDPATNTYSLTVNVTYADAPAGEMISVTTNNGGSMSFTPAGTAATEDFVITSLTSDGVADIDVTATYATTTSCTDELADAYQAPEDCRTFDLALLKRLDLVATPGPFTYGSTVTFSLEVENQGSLDATGVEVADYIPDGLTLVASTVWVMDVDTARLATPFNLASGDTEVLSISFTIDSDFTGTTIDNVAEISEAMNALDRPDEDSTPGDNGRPNDMTDSDDFDFARVSIETVSLGSTVFLDNNNDGLQNGLDAGIANMEVQLFEAPAETQILTDNTGARVVDPANAATVMTDADGNYHFTNLVPGDYYVVLPTAPATAPISSNNTGIAFTETDPDDNLDNDDEGLQPSGAGSSVRSNVITLTLAGEPLNGAIAGAETAQGNAQDDAFDSNGNMNLDFGFFAPVSIGDTAFVDLDENGLQDIGEPGIGGVTVTLLDNNGDVVTMDAEGGTISGETTTDTDGSYSFENLPPGSYSVVFDISTADNAAFYDFTTANAGGDDVNDSDNTSTLTDDTAQSDPTDFLNSGESDLTLDVGVICAIVVVVADPFTICSTQPIILNEGASITPATLGGTWSTPDGTGTFTDGTDFATATTYLPSKADGLRGSVTLILTTDQPDGPCEPISAQVTIEVLNVDCGAFPWDGQ